MAEKQQPAATTDSKAVPPVPEGSSRKLSIMIVGALMFVEGVGIFFATRMLSGPVPATAEAGFAREDRVGGAESGWGGGAKGAPGESDFGEIAVSECRPTNRESGRMITYRMRVSVLVKASNLERAKSLMEANKARIDDRINFVIRSAEPAYLNEPTLATIKRRLKAEFDRLLGDEQLIEEILIPEMLASAAGL